MGRNGYHTLSQQTRIDREHVIETVQVGDHVAKELPHGFFREIGFPKVLDLALQRQIDRLLGRLVESNAAKDVPVPALVCSILLVPGKEKILEGDRFRK